jgi:pilus assembly protein CpaB
MDRRKILLLFGVAWVSAALLSWYLYAKTRMPQAEKKVRIAAAARDLATGTLLRKTDLRFVALPQNAAPRGALFAEKDAIGRVLLYPVGAGEALTAAKLTGPGAVEGVAAVIDRGHRAVSVPISDTSAVAGLVQPGSRVDVLFTRPGSMAEAITSTILENVRVLSIGRSLEAGKQQVDSKGAPRPATVATLIVTPEQAQKVELAKNQGKISLSLRNPLDTAAAANPGPITTEVLDPMVSARLARARKGRTTNLMAADLNDPKVWQELTGDARTPRQEPAKKQEPPPPRVVVDVFRGDKHVQELFR